MEGAAMPVHAGTMAVPLEDLTPFPGNARRGNVDLILDSLRTNGQYKPLVVRRQGDTMTVLTGNHTLLAMLRHEENDRDGCPDWELANNRPCQLCVDVEADDPAALSHVIECDDATAARINLVDNRAADVGTYDEEALAAIVASLDGDLVGTGFGISEAEMFEAGLLDSPTAADDVASEQGAESAGDEVPEARPSLADRFLIPPFDVLDARSGWWRTRKRQWLSLGFRSEVGRDTGLTYNTERADPNFYAKKNKVEAELGRTLTAAEFKRDYYVRPTEGPATGTSIFDPVLCELAYRWFSAPDATVLDPFAGGSVRGLVAGILGRRYLGNDLSMDQVTSNREQGEAFVKRGLLTDDGRPAPVWSVGDSSAWVQTLEPESADLVFTCPPYYGLEVYSDDPSDLSTMGYDAFDKVYAEIIAGAARALRPDRFAVFVVGDARDGKGRLHDLRGSTIRAAEEAGLTYASGAVLITSVGSASISAGRAFTRTRVLTAVHQDVLVFAKGNRSKAAQACGDVEVHLPDDVAAVLDEPAADGLQLSDRP
jgi:DNA modification methylase